ncbi:ubiquitin carboxyl-terminal hydrolase 37-like [Myripristis murdjan]|uniref:ubiquitin carboxyl-terminal hydrolase 37-like n=1 Tax=Myripristis murdjan TaxID=586833 RepID=UPI00117610E7|nr:ubiquitin carboxyl-terminal hydrolase 37-like [Myripristis murdjan]
MNATLQGLYSVPDFCSDIMTQEALWSLEAETCLLLQRNIGELCKTRQGQCASKDKKQLLRLIKSSLAVYNEEYHDRSQQDAHEFLMLLFMGLKMEGEAMATSPGYICPTAKFEFKLQCVRTCASCGDKVFQEEEHNNLSLNLSPFLEDSLRFFFEASELECTCGKCLGRQATVRRSFLTLPRVLVLHMKRFCYSGGQMRRLGDAVAIPPVLSLTSSNKEPVSHTASVDELESSGDTQTSQLGASVSNYHLCGVVSHLGRSIDCGHYISDIMEGDSRDWLTLNDAITTKTDEATVLEERQDTAYILFYVLGSTWSRVPLDLCGGIPFSARKGFSWHHLTQGRPLTGHYISDIMEGNSRDWLTLNDKNR